MVKTRNKQKIALILFGILLFFILLESGLRLSGFVLLSLQHSENKILDNEYTILALGESTTAVSEWPNLLEHILNNKSSKNRFKVINEGISGTNTAFILARLNRNLDRYNPNMVITMMGVNDKYLTFKYDATLSTKITLWFEDFRIFKLSKLLSRAWLRKFKDAKIVRQSNNNETFPEKIVQIENKEEDILYLELGWNYYTQGRYKEAEVSAEMSIKTNPNNSYAYNLLGEIYYQQFRFAEAEKASKKAIEINPDNLMAYTKLGQIYLDRGITNKAEEYYKKAIEINPNDDWTYVILGTLYNNLENITKAEKVLNYAIQLNPYNDAAFVELKRTYDKMGIPLLETERFYRQHGISVSLLGAKTESDYEITKNHYQQLYNQLKHRNIKYVAMQYPTLHIDELKMMFKGDEGIIFVSNDEKFKQALKNEAYEYIFSDRFGSFEENIFSGNFGHTTLKGDRLIAENVANVILKELNIE